MTFSFALLNFSALMLFVLLAFALTMKRKGQLYYAFLFLLISMLLWTVGNVLTWSAYYETGQIVMGYVKMWYIGTCFLPLFLYITALLFKKSRISFTGWSILFFVPPTFSYLMMLTNEINGGLFYRTFSLINTQAVFGPVFYFHSGFSYIYLAMALYHLMTFSTQSSGLFSRQSLLMLTAAIIPITINVIITYRLIDLPLYYTSIAFSITVFLLFISIVKYRFLNLTPIAIQTVLDRMSDSIVVISEGRITYYNRAFQENFRSIDPQLSADIFKIFMCNDELCKFSAKLKSEIDIVSVTGNIRSFEQKITLAEELHQFQIEITPLYTPETNLVWGQLLFIKDTTQIYRANEIINRNQTMLIEQQHLASLGQLIGGIAHNLRTPIMAISGGFEGIRDLVNEYKLSIGDQTVTTDDHLEIADEMLEWINKTKPFCSYMSDILSAVKDQAVRLNESSMNKFTVTELLKRVDLLMKHELRVGHCSLRIDNRTDQNTEIPGTMNNLIQVIGNIIVNAIEAYEETEGIIDIVVESCRVTAGNTCFSIIDYGPGIPEASRELLFKEMTTTKGAKGTGLGLYLSYLTIRGKFRGNMWFESETGQGTTFHISVPTIQTGSAGGLQNEEKVG